MNDLTAEWVKKAESDYRVTLREARATDPPEPDAVCCHAQQCIEKYAKAFLQEQGIAFERTHSMKYLHSKCAAADSEFDKFKADFEKLDAYSSDIRYPGDDAAESDARAAVEIVTRLRAFIRVKLGLDQPLISKGD